ncbi:MAG: DNA primase [Acidobacteria bacterium]|nr:DNA primase [Acidobacteriota bacterium]
MPNPGSFADTVKQQADIVRIVGGYVRLKKTGAQNFSGLCPFHKEKTPSFSVHEVRQFYHCFGCGASGDVFSFVQKIENITFLEAVRGVAEKLGIQAPRQAFSPEEAREAQARGALLEMQERACVFFEQQLRRPEGAQAREYLASRGLSQETIREFRMGYAPDSGFMLRDLFRGAEEELLRQSGLFSWKETEPFEQPDSNEEQRKPPRSALYAKFRGRIMFPICHDGGKVIAFTGRRLSNEEKAGPKYLNSPETAIYSKSRVLFNLDKAKEHIRALGYAILVEGQMDCISVYTADFKNVIATSGTAFTEPQVRLLARHSRNVVVNFDPDAAGAAAAERSLALLVEEDFQIKVLTLEPGLDPDLFIRRRGRQAYADALRSAPQYFGYLVERARALHPPRSPENKLRAANFLLPHLNRVPNRIVRDELAADVAQKLGIDSVVLRQELRRAAAARSSTVKAAAQPALTESEKILIRALHPATAEGGDVARHLAEAIEAESLHRGLAGEALIQAALTGNDAELSEADHARLAAILMRDDEPLTTELLQSALNALRVIRLERTKRELAGRIVEAERRQDQSSLLALVQEKQRIDRELHAAGQ